MSLEGKTAIMFGAGAIGKSIANSLVAEGMNLVVVSRATTDRKPSSEILVDSLGQKEGQRFVTHLADAADFEGVGGVYAFAEKEFGHVHLVVNGSGGNRKEAVVVPDNPYELIDPSISHDMMNANYFAKVHSIKHYVQHLKRMGKEGHVVNITSMAGLTPLSKVVDYGAAYAAAENLTKSMGAYLGQQGLGSVNNIAVGFIVGDQNRALMYNPDGSMSPRGKEILDNIADGRFLTENELGPKVAFLADREKSSGINGCTIRVDGGFGIIALAGTSGYRP
ncbi:MAG: NAD(P)-dependent dehydrogenase (short-subunit alcohol dehydrogenase family) [Candidatus Latescibacterota bacterium]|jgi:NAD(P)-dependent dehydrogenase (short-subunit alcohol dehydrogenase family)